MTDTVRESSSGKGEVAMATDRQMALFGCDLVDLLRREGRHSGVWFADRLLQAADALEALSTPDRARAEVLEEALRPFADAVDDWGDDEGHPDRWNTWEHPIAHLVTLGDFRRARTALAHTTAVSAADPARRLLAHIVQANDEAPDFGMCDCRDNDGEWYQSADLAATLISARRILCSQSPDTGSGA